MTNQTLVQDDANCKRKEPRFKAEEDRLQCETTIAQCGLLRGCVIDLSKSGLRLLCEGKFEVGQPIFAELTTDRSHGIYRGVIRRVEPWVGGKSVLGCSLDDEIPEDVLQGLSDEGVVNRRTEDRVELNGNARLSWPLSQDEFEVELKDFSSGGMKIIASTPIPDDVRLRFRIEQGDQELVVEAKSVWKQQTDDGCVAGVAFTHRDAPKRVACALGLAKERQRREPMPMPQRLGTGLGVAFCIVAIYYAATQII